MNRNFKITIEIFCNIRTFSNNLLNTNEAALKPLNVVFNFRFVLKCTFKTHHCVMCESLNWLQLKSRRDIHWFLFISKCPYFKCPSYLRELLLQHSALYPFRDMQSLVFKVPGIFSATGQKSFHYKASDWNNLPLLLRSILFQVNSIPIYKHSMY